MLLTITDDINLRAIIHDKTTAQAIVSIIEESRLTIAVEELTRETYQCENPSYYIAIEDYEGSFIGYYVSHE